ncbi:hypothetical protein SVAN01_01461 [Stagonosporopsis vannaccii]|nr:hypothetical protein SVAN01_01461 [Stagonosporopsis vannaccii]
MYHERRVFEVDGLILPTEILTSTSTSPSSSPDTYPILLFFHTRMAIEVEDEVDWSDSTIDDPPLAATGASKSSGYAAPQVPEHDGLEYQSEPREGDTYDVSLGTPLPPASTQPTITRVQRAHIGVHLNRRQPLEQDYAHFALYQASQKAYEATFLKHFASHALHPSQFEKCLQDGGIAQYVASVSANINAIANKIIWGAHSRAVNLLASAGKDGAPFWDIDSFDRDTFADFGSKSTTLLAYKMNESWHRTASRSSIIRYTTEDHPIGNHNSLLKEIEEISNTLFSENAFDSSTPAGRTHSLASLIPPAIREEHREPSREETVAVAITHDVSTTTEPRNLSNLSQPQDDSRIDTPVQTPPTVILESPTEAHPTGLTQIERLFEHFGADALSGQHQIENNANSQEHTSQVPPWPMRLFHDHKRRLTQRSQRIFQQVMPGIRAVIVEAISQGYRPVNPDFEEMLVNMEARERSAAAPVRTSVESVITRIAQRENTAIPKALSHSRKRRVEQPAPIRPPTVTATTHAPRKQKTTTARSPKPVKQEASQTVHTSSSSQPLSIHPSGSKTLESHQQLPPAASFTPDSPSDKPAWRCGIKHALGHCYNAGDRRNCPGCFTAISDSINMKTRDFYLPSRTHFHQPYPDARWRPSKPFLRARRSNSLSHNSIAKEAYGAAIASGADEVAAMTKAIAAVHAHIVSKLPKEPTPVPSPSPEPDPGPHPSGSTTMELTQDLPWCASSTAAEEGEEVAWRCDINHALGRYYLAGDKRSCPGCGSNKEGKGRHTMMDFWLPEGVVVRQEVDVMGWKPRRPYRTRGSNKCAVSEEEGSAMRKAEASEAARTANTVAGRKLKENAAGRPQTASVNESPASSSPSKHTAHSRDYSATPTASGGSKHNRGTLLTHNQFASRRYWDAVGRGLDRDEALEWALKETEEWLDGQAQEGVSEDDEGTKDNDGEVTSKERNQGQGNNDSPMRATCSSKNRSSATLGTHSPLTSSSPARSKLLKHRRHGHDHPALTSSLALNALRSRGGPCSPTASDHTREEVMADEDRDVDGEYDTESDGDHVLAHAQAKSREMDDEDGELTDQTGNETDGQAASRSPDQSDEDGGNSSGSDSE